MKEDRYRKAAWTLFAAAPNLTTMRPINGIVAALAAECAGSTPGPDGVGRRG